MPTDSASRSVHDFSSLFIIFSRLVDMSVSLEIFETFFEVLIVPFEMTKGFEVSTTFGYAIVLITVGSTPS
jgi:hypothetical protein